MTSNAGFQTESRRNPRGKVPDSALKQNKQNKQFRTSSQIASVVPVTRARGRRTISHRRSSFGCA